MRNFLCFLVLAAVLAYAGGIALKNGADNLQARRAAVAMASDL